MGIKNGGHCEERSSLASDVLLPKVVKYVDGF